VIKFFTGGGLTVFLYFWRMRWSLSRRPMSLTNPFEVGPVVHVIWVLGLIPMLSGVGHILAGLSIRREPIREIEFPEQQPLPYRSAIDATRYPTEMTASMPREPLPVLPTVRNILDRDPADKRAGLVTV